MENENKFRYVLIGNIIDEHFYGEMKEIKNGTKHFRSGAKVYLFPEYGGMGHEKMPVYGLPKNSFKKINVVISTNLLKNVRVKKTFNSKLIEQVDKTLFYSSEDCMGFESLDRFAEFINKNNIELKE